MGVRNIIGYLLGAAIMILPLHAQNLKPNPYREFIALVDKYGAGLHEPYSTNYGTVVMKRTPERGNRFDIDLKVGNGTLTASETTGMPSRFVFIKTVYFTQEAKAKTGLTLDGYKYMRVDDAESGDGECVYAGIPLPTTTPRHPDYDRVETSAGYDCEHGFLDDLARFTAALKEYGEAKK